MSTSLRTAVAVAVPLGLALAALPALPAAAGDGVLRQGTCSGASDVKVKASHDDGRIEVEGEVDSNRVGQSWSWRISRITGTGSVLLASGTARTVAPSGSFDVERRVANRAGSDTLRFRAQNAATGEVCRATVTI